jgi:hypothetical protein
MLWGRAAGRCQFSDCNRPLWKSSVTQEEVNVAERAHIWSASDEGSRGNEGVPVEKLNSMENLLLFCHECHKKIDKHKDGGRYTTELLQKWKREHEDRIERVGAIHSSKRSHIVVYGAPIGDHSSPLTYEATSPSLFPERYPAADRAITLQLRGSWRDREEKYWDIEADHLRKCYERDLRPMIESGEIAHLSVFGLAPQPLLILFGSLLTDIPAAQTRQLRREPPGWAWPTSQEPTQFSVHRPSTTTGTPALVLSLSATINDDRIHRVLGPDACIWRISVDCAGRDCIGSPGDLAAFRDIARRLIDEVKAAHGEQVALHIFPAVPVSAAIDFGRIRMPKADTAWVVYDESKELGGFIEALTIGTTGVSS